MTGMRCPDCKRLLTDLTQVKAAQFGQIMIEGYCEKCMHYISRPFEIESDFDEIYRQSIEDEQSD